MVAHTFNILDQVEHRNFSFSLFSFGERGDSVGGDDVAPTTTSWVFSLFTISSTLWTNINDSQHGYLDAWIPGCTATRLVPPSGYPATRIPGYPGYHVCLKLSLSLSPFSTLATF